MDLKLNRNYVLTVETRNLVEIPITLPTTIDFDIVRNNYGEANAATIRLYNLSPSTRNALRKDFYDVGIFRTIQLKAGYGNNLYTVFYGSITSCFSYRRGVDFITEIQAHDVGYVFDNAIYNPNKTYTTNMTVNTILNEMIDSLSPYVSPGAVGVYSSTLKMNQTVSGKTTDLLNQYTDNGFHIDNGKAHCLNVNEGIAGPISTIDSSTGLLETPLFQENFLTLDMLFEPTILVSQILTLNSQLFGNYSSPNYNAQWKVVGISHKGMISPVVCGNLTTSLKLNGSFGIGAFKIVSQS